MDHSSIIVSQIWPSANAEYDPLMNATRVGHCEIAGELRKSEAPITIYCWSIGFHLHPHSRGRYRQIEQLLNDVGANGLVRTPLQNVPGDRFSSMTERRDLIGEYATIWVTAPDSTSDARGGVLVTLNGIIVQLIAIAPYEASGNERAVYVLETIAEQMTRRTPELLVAHEVEDHDIIDRLPTLEDLPETIGKATIVLESYKKPGSMTQEKSA